MAGQAGLSVAVCVLGIVFRGPTGAVETAAGGALMGLCALTGILGVLAHGRRLTPFPKPPAGTELIQQGIYARIRHPLYTCNLCGFFGWALLWGSRSALAAALGAVFFFHVKARCEEKWLRERFPAYRAYEKRVKRFIPGLW